jgi:hypothetical protein
MGVTTHGPRHGTRDYFVTGDPGRQRVIVGISSIKRYSEYSPSIGKRLSWMPGALVWSTLPFGLHDTKWRSATVR